MAPDTLERVPEMQDTPPCQLSNKAGLYYYRSAFLFMYLSEVINNGAPKKRTAQPIGWTV